MLITWESDQVASTERPQGDYGRIIVTDNASGIGATAVPDPSSTDGDPDADWYVHQPVAITLRSETLAGVIVPFSSMWMIDSKAMRKVGANDDDVGMFSETEGVGGVLITRGRQLIQLH